MPIPQPEYDWNALSIPAWASVYVAKLRAYTEDLERANRCINERLDKALLVRGQFEYLDILATTWQARAEKAEARAAELEGFLGGLRNDLDAHLKEDENNLPCILVDREDLNAILNR